MGSSLSLRTPAGFDLKRVVCSYGYFLLAPNAWNPASQQLVRPLRIGAGDVDREGDGEIVVCAIGQPGGPGEAVRVACDKRLDALSRGLVKRSLHRMLRIDERLPRWPTICPAARRRRFGRLFRSPTLFEDMVKTITGCNVTWRNTIAMNRRLVAAVGGGAFPSPRQLARWTPSRLKQRCRVGYRADRIIRLARAFDRGDLRPEWFEAPDRSTDELHEALLEIEGFGPYAAANVLQLLGRYDHLPIDTETYRHFCQLEGRTRPGNDRDLDADILARYEPYRPYRFLAYWFELWRDYERRFGDAWTWDPATTGTNFTASVLK